MTNNGLYTLDVEFYNPDRYRLTTQDGAVYIINQNSGLESITDVSEILLRLAEMVLYILLAKA